MPTDPPEMLEQADGAEADSPALLPPGPADSPGRQVSAIAALAEIPEEDIWLAKQKSKRTRRAYKQDVRHFMRTLRICSYEELRQVDHRAVIAWERIMRDIDQSAPSTIRRRLAALSSLMKHLTRHGHLAKNHVTEVERPAINREKARRWRFRRRMRANPRSSRRRHRRRVAGPGDSVGRVAGRASPR